MSNLTKRVLSGVPLAAAVIWMLFWENKVGFFAFAIFGGFLASLELSRITGLQAAPYRAWVSAASLGLVFAIVSPALGAIGVSEPLAVPLLPLLVLIVFGAFALALFEPEPSDRAGWRMAWLLAGPMYLGILLGALLLLFLRPSGGGWLLLAMFFAFFSDTLAYFSGRFFGKKKLFPAVSPKKTWAGAYGGLAGAALGAALASATFLSEELPLGAGIGLALVAGAIGQVGDLLISLVKRSTGTKDSGGLLPGHGGVLDRVDALLLTAATTWVYVEYVH